MKITDIIINENFDELTIAKLNAWILVHKEAKLSRRLINWESFNKAKRTLIGLLSRDTITLYKTIFLSRDDEEIMSAIKKRSGDFGLSWAVNPKTNITKRNPRILEVTVKKESVDLMASIAGMIKDPSKKEVKLINNEHITIVDVLDANTKKSINKINLVVKI